ncbi:MAG: hypothetical protein PVI90_15580 [Desulfobacteraceae bacterium]|jgi:putative Mn2+ efflux pump MntP
MWKTDAKRNISLFFKVGLPYTLIGVMVIFSGIYALKRIFAKSEYLTAILFIWLGLFWMIYQPLFRKRIRKVTRQTSLNGRR